MLKRVLLVAALFASSAYAQTQLDITGKEFLAGAGDAKLAEIARQAVQSGKRITVTAPEYWHQQIAAKLRAAGKVDIQLKDGFFESVAVRLEDKKAEAPAPEPKPVVESPKPTPPAAAPKPAVKPPEPAPVRQAPPAPPVTQVEPIPPPQPTPEPAPVVVETPPPPPAAPVQAAPPPAPTPVPAKPVVDPSVAAKQRFEKSLNEGRAADGALQPQQLDINDVVYVDGKTRAVVRRQGTHTQLFWLEGELKLDRVELKPLSDSRYQVVEPIREGEGGATRAARGEQSQRFVAKIPTAEGSARKQFEKTYNDGRTITRSLRTEELRKGDLVYIGTECAVVVRRTSSDLERYWLDGPIELGQNALLKEGSNKYRALSDVVK